MTCTMKKPLQLCLAASLLSLLAGCMGYRLGGGRPEGIDTVAMAAVVNRTDEPAIELQITHALRERIQFDGRWTLVDSTDHADGIIEVVLTEYDLTPIAYRDEEGTIPQLYRLRVTGTATLKNAETGKEVTSSTSYGESILRFQSDLTSAKRDALPEAAREFAKYMLDDLIEQW